MSNFHQNKTIEIDKEEFQQMHELLLNFEVKYREKLEENKELVSKVEDLESLLKLKEKAPRQEEMINRMKNLLKESSGA